MAVSFLLRHLECNDRFLAPGWHSCAQRSINPTCTVLLGTSAYQSVQDALFRRQHRLVTAGDEAV